MQVTCKKAFELRSGQGRFSMKKGETQDLPAQVAERLIRSGLASAKKGDDDAHGPGKQDGHRSASNPD